VTCKQRRRRYPADFDKAAENRVANARLRFVVQVRRKDAGGLWIMRQRPGGTAPVIPIAVGQANKQLFT
jgi:hypothetical protein